MAVTTQSVQSYGVKAAADLLDRGFADYLVKIRITPDSLRSMVHTDQVDFAASQVLLVDGEPVGAGLISRRGKRCRLSCMCLLPEARGKRLGRELLDQLVAMAAHRGDHEMVLEVIAQNAPAVALYHAAGFETVRELKGYVRPADKQTTNEQVKGSKAISVEAFAAHAAIKETNDVPWQISARTLATASAEQHQAFCIGNDGGVLVNHASSVVRVIRGIVPPADLSELANGLAAVRTTEPQIDWRAPALFPAEWEPAFRAAGFTPTELHQLQLRRPLASSN